MSGSHSSSYGFCDQLLLALERSGKTLIEIQAIILPWANTKCQDVITVGGRQYSNDEKTPSNRSQKKKRIQELLNATFEEQEQTFRQYQKASEDKRAAAGRFKFLADLAKRGFGVTRSHKRKASPMSQATLRIGDVGGFRSKRGRYDCGMDDEENFSTMKAELVKKEAMGDVETEPTVGLNDDVWKSIPVKQESRGEFRSVTTPKDFLIKREPFREDRFNQGTLSITRKRPSGYHIRFRSSESGDDIKFRKVTPAFRNKGEAIIRPSEERSVYATSQSRVVAESLISVSSSSVAQESAENGAPSWQNARIGEAYEQKSLSGQVNAANDMTPTSDLMAQHKGHANGLPDYAHRVVTADSFSADQREKLNTGILDAVIPRTANSEAKGSNTPGPESESGDAADNAVSPTGSSITAEIIIPEVAVASTESSFVANEEALKILHSTGFPLNRCEKALHATGNSDANDALEWIYVHMDDPDIDLPLNSGATVEASVSVNPEYVEKLWKMGFAPAKARIALKETGGNLEDSIDWILSRPSSPDADCPNADGSDSNGSDADGLDDRSDDEGSDLDGSGPQSPYSDASNGGESDDSGSDSGWFRHQPHCL